MADEPGGNANGMADDATREKKRRRRRFRWGVRIIVLVGFVGYLKIVGLDSKFYYPDDEVYVTPAQLGLRSEDVYFNTRDGVRLHGWFLPAMGEARGVIVHFHGNAANVSNHLPLVEWLPGHGYHVLMFDYRGYGQSGGKPTRAGTITDGHAALDYALGRAEADGLPVYFYGQSLGGAVAVVVAAEREEVRAVVAESTFSGYRRIATRHVQQATRFEWPAKTLAWLALSDGYNPIDVVDRISPRPLLVIAAEDDEICFPDLARELYDAAGEPKSFWLAPRASHLQILVEHPLELPERIVRFLEGGAVD